MLGILARFKAYIFCRSEQGLNVTQTHQKELQIAEEKRKKQCASSEKEMRAEQRRTAKAVKRQLRRERQRNKRMLKVVMLGAGETGKSTFLKQMRILHGDGYSAEERLQLAPLVHQNVVLAAQAILRAMDGLLKIAHTSEINELKADVIKALDARVIEGGLTLREPFTSYIVELWNDPRVQEAYARRSEYQLSDSAKYFLDALQWRISDSDYMPTVDDVLHVRKPTTGGVFEYQFTLDNTLFRMIDVGGQRKERHHWLECMDGITSVIFMVSLAEYDLRLAESKNANRLEESLTLFKTVFEYHWFEKVSAILLLNKTDIFAEKLPHSPLANHFPDYEGKEDDVTASRRFIRDMFVAQNTDPARVIYSHFTCATNTENIRFVFAAIKDAVFRCVLRDYSLL